MSSIQGKERAALKPIISARLGVRSWMILIALVSLLLATCVVAYLGWSLADGIDMPMSGYIAMAEGVVVSLAVGFGLMALIFYSSRKGYDEAPALIVPENDSKENGSPSNKLD